MTVKRESGPTDKLSRLRYGAYLFILLCAVVLIYFFAGRDMRFFLVPSSSMEPTLQPGDRIVTLNERQYARGDVVVLRDPHRQESYLVKRIVAVGGDTVAVTFGALFLNGEYASEPYMKEPMVYTVDPISVPEGDVFVLGDNRNHSEDSSTWETQARSQPTETITGKVRFIYFPFDRAGRVPSYPLINASGN